MAVTRSVALSRKQSSLTKRRAYRARVKTSKCRGKDFTNCRLRNGCKRTRANKRKSYCRKNKNSHL